LSVLRHARVQSRALFDAKKAELETIARKKAEDEVKQLRHEVCAYV
jgi:hypothetical protein